MPVLYLYFVTSGMAPFSSYFGHPAMFNTLFLKMGSEDKNYLLAKRITFQSCILKKTQRLVQRTSTTVRLVGVFLLKIMRFETYYFLTGVLLEIKKKKKNAFNQQIA